MEEKTANKRVLETLFKNRVKILLFSIVFAIIAVGVTFFIPKKYTASGIVFPTNSNSMKDVANSNFFGYEFQADRLIQLFESQKMKETITSAEIQKIGLEICIDLATSHDDVASAVADIGVAAYAVSAAIEHAEGHRSVCSTAEKCLSSIASGSSTTGAASGVW